MPRGRNGLRPMDRSASGKLDRAFALKEYIVIP
ncbi:hypothetical protein VITU102760_14845 [Vibrio tubiashii]